MDITFLEHTIEPTLVYNGCHLSSCYNREKEARIQNSTIPLSAEKANLYGVGLGDGVKDLLKRKYLKVLNVYILSPTIFYVYINFFDASSWLNDKRVHLYLAHEHQLKFPYAVNTGELPFSEETALETKNLIQIDKNTAHENCHQTPKIELYKENFSKNQVFIKQDEYIDNLVNKHKGKKFVVIAGGPTATQQFSWLRKQREELIIIAASTALMSLEVAKIIPDYIVTLDASPKLAEHFSVKHIENYRNKTLVYSPIGSHAAIKIWPGIRKIFLSATSPLLQELAKALKWTPSMRQ